MCDPVSSGDWMSEGLPTDHSRQKDIFDSAKTVMDL